jgi:hypothetical protein
MKKLFFTIYISIVLLTNFSFSQITFTIKNASGNPVGLNKVDVYDGNVTLQYTTDMLGQIKVSFPSSLPRNYFFTVADKKSVCGPLSVTKYITVTTKTMTITVPNFPSSTSAAGQQIDQALTIASTAYSLNKWTTTLEKMISDLNAGRTIGYSLPTFGAPGVFSVDPIPRVQDGKLVLKITGPLVDEILNLMNYLNSGKWQRVQYTYL